MIRLNMALLVTRSSGLFVLKSNLQLFENGVTELFKQANIGHRSACAPKGNG
jgi:hypothetical protein